MQKLPANNSLKLLGGFGKYFQVGGGDGLVAPKDWLRAGEERLHSPVGLAEVAHLSTTLYITRSRILPEGVEDEFAGPALNA